MTDQPHPEHAALATPDLAAERRAALQAAFPEAFSDGKFDPARLAAAIGVDMPTAGADRYLFSWAGRRKAIRNLQAPTTATLVPLPDASVNFEATGNLFIEGDNLEVLKLLYRPYFQQVKMIYIDPPYNTGNDFIYSDDYRDSQTNYRLQIGDRNGHGETVVARRNDPNSRENGHYHSNWLSMMYPRLVLASQLLRDDGVIFVSIDDNEVHHLRLLMDEIFGPENFLGSIVWKKKTNGNNMGYIPPVHDFVVAYARSTEVNGLYELPLTEEYISKNYSNPDNDPRGLWTTSDLSANHKGPYFPIRNPNTGRDHYPPAGRYWVFSEDEVKRRIADGRIIFGRAGTNSPVQKKFKNEAKLTVKAESWWDEESYYNEKGTEELKELLAPKVFDSPKSSSLVKQLIKIGSGSNDLILDFFAGSGTTGQAVLELNREDGGNRRFILVQLPEPTSNPAYPTIASIAEERLRRVSDRLPAGVPGDRGFKVFRQQPSLRPAFTGSDPTADEEQYALALERAVAEPVSPDWQPADLIYEVALKEEGYGLNLTYERLAVAGVSDLYRVAAADSGQHFLISLAARLEDAILSAGLLDGQTRFYCLDSAIADNPSIAVNVALRCGSGNFKTI